MPGRDCFNSEAWRKLVISTIFCNSSALFLSSTYFSTVSLHFLHSRDSRPWFFIHPCRYSLPCLDSDHYSHPYGTPKCTDSLYFLCDIRTIYLLYNFKCWRANGGHGCLDHELEDWGWSFGFWYDELLRHIAPKWDSNKIYFNERCSSLFCIVLLLLDKREWSSINNGTSW